MAKHSYRHQAPTPTPEPAPAPEAPKPSPQEQAVGSWYRIRRGTSMVSGVPGSFLERLDVTRGGGAKVTLVHGPDLFGVCEAKLADLLNHGRTQ